jgi:hypothetical protein
MVDKLSPEQNLYMIQARAQGAVDDASLRSKEARDDIESIQQSAQSVLGALGGILKGVFSKGGMKGGGGGMKGGGGGGGAKG